MKISLVVAYGRNRELGQGGQLPWPRLPSDLKRFRDVTLGKPIVMGRKTYQSIGQALPDRVNIVLTNRTSFQAEGCQVAGSVPEALRLAEGAEELMVIGGAEIFKLLLPMARKIYLTEVEGSFEADTFFPEIDQSKWVKTEHVFQPADKKNAYSCRFLVLERRDGGPEA